MSRLFLLSLLIASCNIGDGQFIFTPKKPISVVRTWIEAHETIQLTDSIPFSAIRIIDSRYDTTIIGFHVNGFLVLEDAKKPATLQHVMDRYYGRLCTPGRDTLIIQLEKLSIQDYVMNDTSWMMTSGALSFKRYAGRDGQYTYLGTVDTLMMEKYSDHSYEAHQNGKRLNFEFWDWYLLRLCEAMILNQPDYKPRADEQRLFSMEEIRTAGLQKRNKPILATDSLRSGFYREFSEFVNNAPSVACDPDSLHRQLKAMHYRVDGKPVKDTPDGSYWGFSDGHRIFIWHEYNFFQLERRDAGFYISPTLDAKRRDSKRLGWNFLIGLASITTSIASRSDINLDGFSAIPPPSVPVIRLQLWNAFAAGLQLDWDSGVITF